MEILNASFVMHYTDVCTKTHTRAQGATDELASLLSRQRTLKYTFVTIVHGEDDKEDEEIDSGLVTQRNKAPRITRSGRKVLKQTFRPVANFENNLFSTYLTFVNNNDKKYISYLHEKELLNIALTALLLIFGGVEYLLFTAFYIIGLLPTPM